MKREKVISAVSHKNTEPVPHDIDLTVPAAEAVCSYLGISNAELWVTKLLRKNYTKLCKSA